MRNLVSVASLQGREGNKQEMGTGNGRLKYPVPCNMKMLDKFQGPVKVGERAEGGRCLWNTGAPEIVVVEPGARTFSIV